MDRILALALMGLMAMPATALAQGSPWGGPDSPGGLFGGDPLDADTDRDRSVTHDEVWGWLRQAFNKADRDRSGTLSAAEVPARPGAQTSFRAADADRNGQMTIEELRPLSESWFRAHDANGDGVLTRREVPVRKPKPPR